MPISDKRYFPAIRLLFILLFLPIPAHAENDLVKTHAPVKLERVIDGDTLIASDTRIRLWGIDAPEMDTPAGPVAKMFLESLLKGREELDCKFIDRDRYERSVMHCLSDGMDLGSMMVQMGMAKDNKTYSGGYYQFEEELAQKAKRGIWKEAGPAAPTPLLEQGDPVKWWFTFKFNSAAFPACGDAPRACPFGGNAQPYTQGYGQQFVYASDKDQTLKKGSDCLGDTTADPVGSTFDEVYNGTYYYVVWNDQFYSDPPIHGCGDSCSAPWGHSKGLIAWDDSGNGLVMQVSTPSWPAAGSKKFPRQHDGNTLGCIEDDNIKVSQHFFSLKLTKDDVVKVLKALQNASVVTDPENRQIVNNGGPAEIQALVKGLGHKSKSTEYLDEKLSSGVELISKPSKLHVPPWQMVSAILDGVSLRTATWWTNPKIYTTTEDSEISCWSDTLGKPGAVEVSLSGIWQNTGFKLKGGPGKNSNHAKLCSHALDKL